MAKKGRLFLLQRETATPGTYATVGGFQSNEMSINNEVVDVTTKGEAPWRELLADAGLRSVSLSGEGVMANGADLLAVQAAALSGAALSLQMISDFGDKFQGDFLVTNFTRSGGHTGGEQFSCSFESTGAVTYVAAP